MSSIEDHVFVLLHHPEWGIIAEMQEICNIKREETSRYSSERSSDELDNNLLSI
jgi:hypothetical protein